MTIVKEVTVEGIRYPVTVSDDNEALLAAAAAGRAIIGIWDPSVRPLGAVSYTHLMTATALQSMSVSLFKYNFVLSYDGIISPICNALLLII